MNLKWMDTPQYERIVEEDQYGPEYDNWLKRLEAEKRKDLDSHLINFEQENTNGYSSNE